MAPFFSDLHTLCGRSLVRTISRPSGDSAELLLSGVEVGIWGGLQSAAQRGRTRQRWPSGHPLASGEEAVLRI